MTRPGARGGDGDPPTPSTRYAGVVDPAYASSDDDDDAFTPRLRPPFVASDGSPSTSASPTRPPREVVARRSVAWDADLERYEPVESSSAPPPPPILKPSRGGCGGVLDALSPRKRRERREARERDETRRRDASAASDAATRAAVDAAARFDENVPLPGEALRGDEEEFYGGGAGGDEEEEDDDSWRRGVVGVGGRVRATATTTSAPTASIDASRRVAEEDALAALRAAYAAEEDDRPSTSAAARFFAADVGDGDATRFESYPGMAKSTVDAILYGNALAGGEEEDAEEEGAGRRVDATRARDARREERRRRREREREENAEEDAGGGRKPPNDDAVVAPFTVAVADAELSAGARPGIALEIGDDVARMKHALENVGAVREAHLAEMRSFLSRDGGDRGGGGGGGRVTLAPGATSILPPGSPSASVAEEAAEATARIAMNAARVEETATYANRLVAAAIEPSPPPADWRATMQPQWASEDEWTSPPPTPTPIPIPIPSPKIAVASSPRSSAALEAAASAASGATRRATADAAADGDEEMLEVLRVLEGVTTTASEIARGGGGGARPRARAALTFDWNWNADAADAADAADDGIDRAPRGDLAVAMGLPRFDPTRRREVTLGPSSRPSVAAARRAWEPPRVGFGSATTREGEPRRAGRGGDAARAVGGAVRWRGGPPEPTSAPEASRASASASASTSPRAKEKRKEDYSHVGSKLKEQWEAWRAGTDEGVAEEKRRAEKIKLRAGLRGVLVDIHAATTAMEAATAAESPTVTHSSEESVSEGDDAPKRRRAALAVIEKNAPPPASVETATDEDARRREEKKKLRAGLVDMLADLQRARVDTAAGTSDDVSPATKRREEKRKLRESLEDMLSDVRRAKEPPSPPLPSPPAALPASLPVAPAATLPAATPTPLVVARGTRARSAVAVSDAAVGTVSSSHAAAQTSTAAAVELDDDDDDDDDDGSVASDRDDLLMTTAGAYQVLGYTERGDLTEETGTQTLSAPPPPADEAKEEEARFEREAAAIARELVSGAARAADADDASPSPSWLRLQLRAVRVLARAREETHRERVAAMCERFRDAAARLREQARSIHWSPYDRVGDVNADP